MSFSSLGHVLSLSALTLTALGGCLSLFRNRNDAGTEDSNSPCQFQDSFQFNRVQAYAGCLIHKGNQVLLVNEVGQGWNPPGGGGREGENVGQTACRQTFESLFHASPNLSVASVNVGPLVSNFDGVSYLFECSLDKKGEVTLFQSLPRDGAIEVAWQYPATLPDEEWRYPIYRTAILSFLGISVATRP